MKSFLKTLGISLLALVLLAAGYAGALYAGWVPVPGFVTGWLAASKGLSADEAESLDRTVNLYRVLKTSPEAPLLDEALGMALSGSPSSQWAAFARKAWPQISAETKEKLRAQLAVDPDDFRSLEALIGRQMAVVEKEGAFRLTAAEAEQLNQFEKRYRLMETLAKLR